MIDQKYNLTYFVHIVLQWKLDSLNTKSQNHYLGIPHFNKIIFQCSIYSKTEKTFLKYLH